MGAGYGNSGKGGGQPPAPQAPQQQQSNPYGYSGGFQTPSQKVAGAFNAQQVHDYTQRPGGQPQMPGMLSMAGGGQPGMAYAGGSPTFPPGGGQQPPMTGEQTIMNTANQFPAAVQHSLADLGGGQRPAGPDPRQSGLGYDPTPWERQQPQQPQMTVRNNNGQNEFGSWNISDPYNPVWNSAGSPQVGTPEWMSLVQQSSGGQQPQQPQQPNYDTYRQWEDQMLSQGANFADPRWSGIQTAAGEAWRNGQPMPMTPNQISGAQPLAGMMQAPMGGQAPSRPQTNPFTGGRPPPFQRTDYGFSYQPQPMGLPGYLNAPMGYGGMGGMGGQMQNMQYNPDGQGSQGSNPMMQALISYMRGR